MLPTKNRVDTKAVEMVMKKGLFLSSPNITFRYIKQTGSPEPRISFVAPKAVSKLAVSRNLLRRRGYAAVSKYIGALPDGIVGVFFFGKKSLEIFGGRKNKNRNPTAALEYEIKEIVTRIH